MHRLLTAFFLISSIFVSCSDKTVSSRLDMAASSIEDNPESSLSILESIDRQDLSTRSLRARFSLLYSIALDKNYVDLQSDSIIAPALKYYKNRGSAEEKFQTYYYRARISENAGDDQEALLWSNKAEEIDPSKLDAYDLCLLYSMKGSIYFRAWQIDDASESYQKAADYALQADKQSHYVYYLLMLADIARYKYDYCLSGEYLKKAEKYYDHFNLNDVHTYHSLVLLNMKNTEAKPEDCIEYLDEYLENNPQYEIVDWHIMASIYLYAGDPQKAYEMLNRYAQYNEVIKKPNYYGVLARVLEQLGEYQDALASHRIFAEMVKQGDIDRHEANVKFAEQKFKNELVRQRYQTAFLLVALCLLFLLVILIFVLRRWLKRRHESKLELEQLKQEYSVLVQLRDSMEATLGAQSIDYEMLKVFGHRIEALSAFFKNPVPDSLSKATCRVEDLKKGRNHIIESIGILCAMNYPAFITELSSHDLTSAEIGYCCLYLLGVNIPEAGEVVGRVSSIYNINAGIHKKLGIGRVRLDRWIQNLFLELYPNA